MRIAVIGIVGVPASYGGFETLVECLLDPEQGEFTVYCSSRHYQERLGVYKKAQLVYLPFNPNGSGSVLYDIFSVIHAIFTGHRQLLVLGVSGGLIIPILRFFFPQVRVVTNIDGIEWRRQKWRGFAKIFLKFSERLAVKYSTKVVVDNQAIADYVSEVYGRRCDVIAYGGDHALLQSAAVGVESPIAHNKPYALSLCRIEPENNVHTILEAFSESTLDLVFIGNWKNSSYGRALYAQYLGYPHIKLLDPIYDVSVLFSYRAGCSVYVHGHSAGGTNPSLVEMMHFGKPIIAYDCVFNQATMEGQGYFFNDANTLSVSVGGYETLSGGDCLLSIARRRYTWDIVRKQYSRLFS